MVKKKKIISDKEREKLLEILEGTAELCPKCGSYLNCQEMGRPVPSINDESYTQFIEGHCDDCGFERIFMRSVVVDSETNRNVYKDYNL